MIKLIILIALLFSASLSAQLTPKFAFDYFLEGNKTNIYDVIEGENYRTEFKYRIRSGATYQIKRASFYFEQHVYMNSVRFLRFSPYHADWFVGCKFRISDKINIQYEHLCRHPVIAAVRQNIRITGGYDMISISYGY